VRLDAVASEHMALLARLQHVHDLIVAHQSTRARHALAAILVAGDDE
jgi:hypothetical protein